MSVATFIHSWKKEKKRNVATSILMFFSIKAYGKIFYQLNLNLIFLLWIQMFESIYIMFESQIQIRSWLIYMILIMQKSVLCVCVCVCTKTPDTQTLPHNSPFRWRGKSFACELHSNRVPPPLFFSFPQALPSETACFCWLIIQEETASRFEICVWAGAF